jgi:hypothetical protein
MPELAIVVLAVWFVEVCIEKNNSLNRIINYHPEARLWQYGAHELEQTYTINNIQGSGYGNERIARNTRRGRDTQPQPGSTGGD